VKSPATPPTPPTPPTPGPASLLGMPLLIWRTVAPLRWEQIVYRPWRMAQKRLYRHVPVFAERWRRVAGPGPPVSGVGIEAIQGMLREEGAAHLLPAPDATLVEEWEAFQAGRFTFLGRSRTLPAPDWNARYESHLWNFQLHYFSWTLDCVRQRVETGAKEPFERCRRLIEQWIDEARPGRSDGWDAYPLSLRVVHWIYGYCLLATIEPALSAAFLDRWRGSMHRQLAFLSHHLEHHLLANHLFKNAKALVIGGVLFGERRWLREGLRLLWRETEEQVLPDGGHFERAPMYHAQTLADLLECVAVLRRIGEPIPPEAAARLSAMVAFLDAVRDQPGDRLAAFNDTASTRDTRPGPLLETARRLGIPLPAPCPPNQAIARQFPETGYHVWIRSDASGEMIEKILVDTGPPSVSYNTAHAHCDLLSFELHLGGHLWIADTGVHGYGGDPFRAYCRSTWAHNTITIDGQEQSEIWGTFRMGRRAEPLSATSQGEADEWTCQAAYRPGLHRGLRHQRRFRRAPDGSWTIEDRILAPAAKRRTSPPRWLVESFLHLTPEISVEREGVAPGLRLSRGTVHYRLLPFGESLPEIEIHRAVEGNPEGWLFPAFGVAVPGTMLTCRWTIGADQPFGFRLLPEPAGEAP